MVALEDSIKQQAIALGFDLVGIAPATPADGFGKLLEWLEQDFAGEMSYMARHAEARRHPSSILPDVRSVVMVAMNYKDEGGRKKESQANLHNPSTQSAMGHVARYARGPDYHDILRKRLNQLLTWLQGEVPGCHGRGVVDTAPLLERDFARRAGLGWFGKNTMLLNKQLGSYFFLGALLLDLDLQPDPVHESSHCGTCTACLEACPTQAFPEPGRLDARRCISYLTIELKNDIPEEFRSLLSDWVFGCDVCQEVCPWNHKAPASKEPVFHSRPDLKLLDLVDLLGLSPEDFRQRFRGTALVRARRRGLLRNAALLLGNQGDPATLPALRQALADPESMVRKAAQWAIDQIQLAREQKTIK